MAMKENSHITSSKEETMELGKKIASLAMPGDVVLLNGGLGSGKTTLVKGAGEALGVKDPVISPTFNILKCYFKGSLPMYHIDGYRLEGQNLDIGLEEAIYGNGITFIEWPVYLAAILPEECLVLDFEKLGDEQRKIVFTAKGKRAEEMLRGIFGK